MVAGSIIFDEVDGGGRVLVLADRIKLAKQFAKATEMDYGIMTSMDGDGLKSHGTPVVTATVQTMASLITKRRFSKSEFDLMVMDEAHGALAPSFKGPADYFNCPILGLTATPARSDKKDLMEFFDEMVEVEGAKLQNLIKDGYLAPLTIQQLPITIQLTETDGKKRADYTEEDIDHAIDPYLERCAESLVELAKERCTLVFLPLIKTSKKFVTLLNRLGHKAEHVDGEMEAYEVERVLHRLEMGTTKVVCSSMLLTQGVDIRMVNCIFNLRPTKSWTLLVQIIGRGTRLFDPAIHPPEGTIWTKKKDALVIDPMWVTEELNILKRPAHIIASSDEEAEEIQAKIRKGGGGVDLMGAVASVAADREEAMRERLRLMSKRRGLKLNAMEFFLSLHRPDLAEYEPMSKLDKRKVSDNQRAFLEKKGFDMDDIKTFGHARSIIDKIVERGRQDKCTIPQALYCQKLGHPDPFSLGFNEAREYIEKNKRPGGYNKPWRRKWK